MFIPFKEPWRNGYIENFNKRFNELLWQSKRFKDLKELRVESKKFRINITTIRNIKKIIFSAILQKGYTRRLLPEGFTFDPSEELPKQEGEYILSV
ncbi:MAG: transposase [Candidatus Scalindua sp.]|nr:transposase [Candidatus Scalindua sp.]